MLRADPRSAASAADTGAETHQASPQLDVARQIMTRFKGTSEAAVSPIVKHHGAAGTGLGPFLSAEQCATLISYMDSAPEQGAHGGSQETDFQLDVAVDDLRRLCGGAAVDAIVSCFGEAEFKIKLRRVRAEAGHMQGAEGGGRRRDGHSLKAIDFHVDVHERTMQVFLNEEDDYAGGRVFYATSQGLDCPPRPMGCATIHDCTIPHGVSALRRGTRYSLFLLSKQRRVRNG